MHPPAHAIVPPTARLSTSYGYFLRDFPGKEGHARRRAWAAKPEAPVARL